MTKASQLAGILIGPPLVALLALILAPPAQAECRNVWAPSPDGGQLILVCDGNTGSGGGGKTKEKKKRKEPPQFGAIAQNPIPVGTTYTGATSAGYTSKAKAKRRALLGCARASGGSCEVMATVRNEWTVLVAAGGPGGLPQFFSGRGKTHSAAQDAAERRAEEALGSGRTGPTKLVVGVEGRAPK